MFERLKPLPPDPILGLMASFRADPDPRKIDLGVGVYRDELGETPVLEAVREAERALLECQTTKAYVGPVGNEGFNRAIERLSFGDGHPATAAGRVRTLQTPGGSGALRLAAELVRAARPEAVACASTPSWANHLPVLSVSGLCVERYPYYAPATGGVAFPAMLQALERLPSGTLVVLQASCHNPTGADLSPSEWRELLRVVSGRGLVPLLDMAYQGLGDGLAEDAFGVRLLTEALPEVLVAVSCSKNFGLYRERTGALHLVCQTPDAADAALSQVVRIARTMYSMPPDHGAAVVHEILNGKDLRAAWVGEVAAMRGRLSSLRRDIVSALAQACPERDFSFVERQKGMFSHLGIEPRQVLALRERHHVYATDDGRINVAGLNANNVGYFAHALASVSRGEH